MLEPRRRISVSGSLTALLTTGLKILQRVHRVSNKLIELHYASSVINQQRPSVLRICTQIQNSKILKQDVVTLS